MSETPLETVKGLIAELSAEERQGLIPFLASLPDSGLQSYDLSEEVGVIQETNTIKDPPPDAVPVTLFQIVIPVRNVTEIHMNGLPVLRVTFQPDHFAQAFTTCPPTLIPTAVKTIREEFSDNMRAELRLKRESAGITDDDASFEQAIEDTCKNLATRVVTAKGERVAHGISIHLPRMVGDMFDQAMQGQTFADFNRLAEAMGRPEKQYSAADLKKMLTRRYWAGVKPHLGITRRTRTNPAWNLESKKDFAYRVSDRKGLAARIKEVFDDCEGEDTWIEDLKQDSTFQLLSTAVDDEVVNWAIRRIASEDVPSRVREPLSVACEIARRELDLPEQDIETLRNYYGEGFKAIRTERKSSGK